MAIVFIMVASGFAVLNVRGESGPAIWPSEEMYVPGENVKIYGSGWQPFGQVTIEMAHPDFETKTYILTADVYGKFVCSNYTATGVTQWDVPVQVQATQIQGDVSVTATTQFFDPAISLQGYTLKPNPGWTAGDVKGYNEGDSVPYKVKLEKKSFGPTVTVTMGFDYRDVNTDTYGIDFLVNAYHTEPPASPFNIYTTPSPAPFWVDPAEGVITSQTQLPNDYDSGSGREILVWQFTLAFAAPDATVKWGAHMAISDLDIPYYGASYFPGSSLHIRVVELDPPSNQGNRDVPIALGGQFPVLTPPKMTLEKVVDPDIVVPGDTITFTITWSNIGQADATCVVLTDTLDWAAEIIPGSFLFWTSENPIKMAPSPGPVLGGQSFTWDLGYWRGTGVDGEDPVLYGYLEFKAVIVDEAQPGCYYNNAWLTYSDNHGGLFDELHAWAKFCIPAIPSIDIEKSGPLYAHVGDTITYTYTVTNGALPLHNVDIIDDVAGVIALNDNLAAGEVKLYSKTYTILAGDPDLLVNTVTITGDDNYERTVSDSDQWKVDILHPVIDVEKTASLTCAAVGEDITYTIFVKNPSSDTDLFDVTVSDPILGFSWTGNLLAGASHTFIVPYTMSDAWGDPMVNTVTASGEDLLGKVVSDSDTVSVDVVHPAVLLTKVAREGCAAVGELMTYTLTVINPITADVWLNGTLIDAYNGASWSFTNLRPGQTFEKTITIVVPNMDPFVNVAYVDAWDHQRHHVYARAEASVDVYHPMIQVTKTADVGRCAAIGDTVTYTITVSNPSEDTWMNYDVIDAALGWSASGRLAPLGSDVYTLPYIVTAATPDPFVNIVNVWAHDDQYNPDSQDAWRHVASDSDSWEINILHAMIDVEKSADVGHCAAIGDWITYKIVVSNPSPDTWMNYNVEDLMLGFSASGYLAPMGSDVYYLYYYVTSDTPDPLVNLAYVKGWDDQYNPQSDDWINHFREDRSTWEIDILHAMIDVKKTADVGNCAAVGDTVTYTIVVSNPSDDTWMNYQVTDPMLGWSASGYLEPLGSDTYTLTYLVTPDTPDEFINEAYVWGWDDQWETSQDYWNHEAFDWDSWWIDILHPMIDVEKYADVGRCAAVGDTIIYTIIVSNPSWDTGVTYEVNDPMLGFFATGYLNAGESDTYTVPYVVTDDTADPLINVVDVKAWDDQYNPQSPDAANHLAFDSAMWEIDILHAMIDVQKSADVGNCAAIGDTVTYRIVVSNPSPDTWMNFQVWDNYLGWSGSGYLAPGGSVTFYVPYTVTADTPDPFVNEVWVWGYDDQYWNSEDWRNHEVSDMDSWKIDILHAMIDVEKSADLGNCAQIGDVIIYTIVVTNPSPDTWMTYFVFDDTLLWMASGYLAPGDSDWYTVPYTVTEDTPDPFENLAYVYGYDDQYVTSPDWWNHYAYDDDEWVVDILHPGIEVTKWATSTFAEEGEVVSYEITVTNPSDDTPMDFILTDSLFGVIWGFGTGITGDKFGDPYWTLGPGESITFGGNINGDVFWQDGYVYIAKLAYVVTGEEYGDPLIPDDGDDPFTNIATVEAWDYQDHHVWDRDFWTVDVMHPGIKVEKSGPDYASVGETITYFINVTNTGDVTLYDVSIDDSLVGADLYTIPVLLPGETVMLSYTYLVPPGSEPFDNIVTATGRYWVDRYISDDDEWTVKRYSSVSGFKYADLSLDEQMNGGEPGLGNWVITLEGDLYEGGHVSMTRLTDSLGQYQFLLLKPGDYTVSEVMQSGWIHITAASSSFSLGMGQTYNLDFGNMPTGNISGYKWHDLDIDGIWDLNEPGIEGWMIHLVGEDVSGQTIDIWTMTDANGLYMFDDLLPGEYLVLEELRLGWYATTPTQVVVDVSELVPFEIQGVNFGNAKYGMITGYKWEDEYMNGIWDGYELPVPGVVIGLEGTLANGEHFGPIYTTTNAAGFYAFYDLLPGVYTVWEILPDGWINILPSSYDVTIDEGSYVFCAKFANVRWGSIDGFKFLDWDMDGLFDGNEVGISGWQITLTGWLNDGDWPWAPDGATHIEPITITTDANGFWEFPDLLPGVYTVTEETRDLWYNTTADHYHIWLTSGKVVFDVKFGNVPYTCIWGHKFNDNNGNGVQDPGELGVPNWPIVIVGTQNDGTPVHIELLTDADGVYKTCYRILPGTYTIYEVMLQGWMPITPMEVVFEVPMSMEPMVYMFDFGNFKLGKIWGYKYEDVNGNGILDDGDKPIPNWDIYIQLPWGGTGVTSTDQNGYYEFIGLPFGWYWVYEILPDGWICTAAPDMPVLVLSGSDIGLEPFLNFHYGTICGWKFEDLNSNGVWDDGEPPIRGWTIYMVKNGDPELFWTTTNDDGSFCFNYLMPDQYAVFEDTPLGWTPTTPTGYVVWILSGDHIKLPPFGNFRNVWIELFKFNDTFGDGYYDSFWDTPIEGWHITVSGPGVPGGSVTVVTDEFGYAYVELTAAGEYTITEEARDGWVPTTDAVQYVDVISGIAMPWHVEFGNFECVDITIFKYEDVDSSGDYDPQIDRPIEGWTFYFYDYWGYQYFEKQTDENGEINLRLCTYGEWWVYEEARDGWTPVNPEWGYHAFVVQSGLAINLYTGEEQYVYEFGNFQCVEINVFKYWDTCSNGWYDTQAGDVPIEGWAFRLFDEQYNLLDIFYTDENGMVTIMICEAGVYYVAEESRYGWSWITPENGYYMVEIESGLDPIWLYFGNYEHVKVPIFKYEDMNSNGVYDNDDVPIEGWYFEMTRVGDPSTVYSGYTDDTGMLVFTVDRSGIYLIDEEERADWIHVNPSSGTSLVNVISGIEVPTQMFGNFHKARITVCKVDDVNANGQFDPELDSKIPGWTFQLWIAVGMDQDDEYIWELVETKVTDQNGCVSFEILKAGIYKVTEEAREGWIWINPSDGETWEMWVHSGSDIGPIAFYNFKKGTIHGYKWNDVDGDGIWDDGEPPLPDWTIWFEGWLYPFGWMTGITTTDENGYYEFTGLPPGEYNVWEVQQDGWIPTTPPSVWVDIIGHSEERVDFGNFQLGRIDGYKYEDMNGNGVYDNGDVPIPQWTIYLAITTGIIDTPEGPISAIMLIAITTTDADGHYQFYGLGPGLYVVSEEQRAGWTATSPTSETVRMTSGAHIRIHDFLNFELGTICGWKFEDLNSNGVWDDGEPAIEGWRIEMIKNGDPTGRMTWTDDEGFFCFTGLTADKYAVWEEDRDGWTPTTQTGYVLYVVSGTSVILPAFGNFENVWIPIFKYEDVNGNGVYDNGDVPIEDWDFTVSGPGFDVPVELETDVNGMTGVWVTEAGSYLVKEEDREGWIHVNPASGEMSVDLISGMVLAPLEFGNFVAGRVTGYKFYDWNMNGVQDDGEEGLSGWVIWIDGELVGGGTVHYTRITDTTGHYEVLGLEAGEYTVSERLELAPPGWVPTTPPSVEIDVESGTAQEVAFGNVVNGMIWGYKFYDKNMDSYRDDIEPGLGGWLIILDGMTDKDVPVHMETITDENGYYEFIGLLPGEYSITEVIEDGWYTTMDLPIVVDVSGSMVYFEIQVDIGNIRFAKICGYKFLDTYEDRYPFWPNGAFDGDEYGLGNWKITLQGWTEDGVYISLVQFTDNEDNIGWYCFDRLLPGMYWVNETLLRGYYATKPISNLVMVYPHPMGPVSIRIDFGNMIPSPDPEMNFILKAGWNLWSVPMKVTGLTAKGLLDAIGPSGLMVVKLDKVTGKYVSWVRGDENIPSLAGNNFAIVLGSGYYVWANGATNFKLLGILAPTTDSPLAAGWNMVGYNTLEPMHASEMLSKAKGTNAWIIVEYDSSAAKYVSYVKGDPAKYDFLVTPGRAYYVWADGVGAIDF
jgi:uncharacterized repeat protein (TIGR01451 family)